MLKELDRILGPASRILGSCLPNVKRKTQPLPLIIRPGGMGDLICADIALQQLGLSAQEFLWLIERRSRPWAEYRGLPFLCYDENPSRILRQIWRSHSLVINTEQLFGLAQGCALFARANRGRVACFDTVRGSHSGQVAISYDWRDAHESSEFARLFAAALGLPKPTLPQPMRSRRYPVAGLPLVVVAGLQSRSRALGLERWTRLVEAWCGGRRFLIAASPIDASFADQLAHRFAGIGSRHEGNFAQLCEAIAQSPEVLTMDGGPVHIASFFGVPTVALFTSGRYQKWAPLGLGSRVIRRHDLPCQPCTKFGQIPPCPIRFQCRELENVDASPPSPPPGL